MTEILISILAGIVTAMGMGGGIILILFLTIFLGIDQKIAQATNLIFFIPTAITTIILNLKNKNIDIKTGLNIIIFGIFGAIIGAICAQKVQTENLRKIFGIYLFFVGVHEIYNFFKLYIKKKNTNNTNEEVDENEVS